MTLRCDPTTPESLNNQNACHEAAVKVAEQLKPVIEIRHQIGEAMMAPEGRTAIPALEKKLLEAAKPIIDSYSKEEEECKRTDNAESCINTEQFKSFTKFFGPIIPQITNAQYVPVSIEMAHLKSGTLVVPVGSEYEVILDTGAQHASLSVEMAKLFKSNIKPLAKTEYGQGTFTIAINGISFNLGGIKYEPEFGMVTPIIDFLEGSDRKHKLAAILGAGFLFSRSWKVDYDRSSFVIGPDIREEVSKNSEWSRIPLTPVPYYSSFCIGAEVFIDGLPFQLALDTGADSINVIEQCSLPETTTSKKVSSVSLEGVSEEKKLENIPVRFGGSESTEKVTIIQKDSVNAKWLHEAKQCGLLGTAVLRRYNYIFDPKTFSLYIRPRIEKDITRPHNIGIVPKRVILSTGESAFAVTHVTPDSPGEKAGLKIGDLVVEINGRKTHSMSMLEFLEMKYSTRSEIPITVVRNGEIKQLMFRIQQDGVK